eukprot:607772-Rhodomonas_salina.1
MSKSGLSPTRVPSTTSPASLATAQKVDRLRFAGSAKAAGSSPGTGARTAVRATTFGRSAFGRASLAGSCSSPSLCAWRCTPPSTARSRTRHTACRRAAPTTSGLASSPGSNCTTGTSETMSRWLS